MQTLRPAVVDEVVDLHVVVVQRAVLEYHILAVDGIVHVLHSGQFQPKHLVEEALAVGALAGAEVVAAVVAGDVAAHVEEDAVEGQLGEQFLDDERRVDLLIVAVDADVDVPVVVDDLAGGADVGPFRV